MSALQLMQIIQVVNSTLYNYGFDVHPFKVQWYNHFTESKYQLRYDADTIAMTVIGRPDMFEKAVKTLVCHNTTSLSLEDPHYDIIMFYMKKIKQEFSNIRIITRSTENHRSNLNTNIAAHVTGVAYRYTQSDVLHKSWPKRNKLREFAIHHTYGAWFTVPAIIIFKGFKNPNLLYPVPYDVIPSHENRKTILDLYDSDNISWRQADFIPTTQSFSKEAKQYFFSKNIRQKYSVIKNLERSCHGGGFLYYLDNYVRPSLVILSSYFSG